VAPHANEDRIIAQLDRDAVYHVADRLAFRVADDAAMARALRPYVARCTAVTF